MSEHVVEWTSTTGCEQRGSGKAGVSSSCCPRHRHRSQHGLRFFGRFRAGPDGEFELDVPPGSYLVYSADVYQNQHPTPEWLLELQDQLVTAVVAVADEVLVQVPLIGR